MELKDRLEGEIVVLTQEIEQQPDDYTLYMERGKLYHRSGRFDCAMNDFIKVHEIEPSCVEATEYIVMLKEIFAFRYVDIYNP